MAMLCLRTTPLDHGIPSPGELLYNRKMQANLPIRVRNTAHQRDDIHQRLLHRQDSQKHHFDQHAHDLPPLSVGQQVRIQDQSTHHWVPASVKEVCTEPRSYVVATPSGSTLRRNRRHIAEAPQPKSVRLSEVLNPGNTHLAAHNQLEQCSPNRAQPTSTELAPRRSGRLV